MAMHDASQSSSNSADALMCSPPLSSRAAHISLPSSSSSPSLSRSASGVSSSNRLPMSPLSRFQPSPSSSRAKAAHLPSSSLAIGSTNELQFLPAHIPWWQQEQQRREAQEGQAVPAHSSSDFRGPSQRAAAAWSSSSNPPWMSSTTIDPIGSSWATTSITDAQSTPFYSRNRPFETMPWNDQATTRAQQQPAQFAAPSPHVPLGFVHPSMHQHWTIAPNHLAPHQPI